MVLNVSKEFMGVEQKLEEVFKTIGNGLILQKDELHIEFSLIKCPVEFITFPVH